MPTSVGAAISPHGAPRLDAASTDAEPLDAALAKSLSLAFARGPGHGVLALAAVPDDADLAPSLAHLRAFARLFLAEACKAADLDRTREASAIPEAAELDAWRESAPPMTGAEYLTAEVVEALWGVVTTAFFAEWAEEGGSVECFLERRGSRLHQVGRVFFHLAENNRDPAAPFAFLATYTTGLSAKEQLKHVPLGQALEQYAGAKNKGALLSLLAPVERAAEDSAFVRRMVDGGEIYHPLAWTPRDAYAFLQEVPALETSGVVVRLPDWWRAKSARPEVQVRVGERAPSSLGADALLDFSVDVALDGEPLTKAEWERIASASTGLVSLRGRWVEVDPERLRAVLAHWKGVEREAGKDGISFLAGMRLLAGVALDAREEKAQADEVRAWSHVTSGAWLAGTRESARAASAAADPGKLLKATLRPYQREGVRWLYTMTRLGLGACLADDMGLGKTIQVLALLLLLARERGARARTRPSLLVLPASLLGNWRSELSRFAPSLRALFAHPGFTDAKELEDVPEFDLAAYDLVLTTYGAVVRMPWIARASWDLVILDEAQAIKNPGAKQTRAVKSLRARSRVALTGTPVENRTGDLHSLFDFLLPGLLGSPKAFTQLTKRLGKDPRGFAPLRALVRPYMLRRLKTDRAVVGDLPDKTELRAFCPLTREQAALYQQAVDAMKAVLARSDGIERRGAVLSFLVRFKQICNHPSQLRGDGVWDETASGKFLRLTELCEPMAARQEKALVFTQFREMTAPLALHLEKIFGRPGLVLHGGTAVAKRKALVDAFQSDAGPPFFVLSLKAGGTGLNLTAASHVIHFDRWWNPAVENQATDRAYRIGQKKNVLVHKLVCRGTLEEKIDQMLEEKRALADALVEGGGEVALTEMSDAELTRLVSLDIHAALAEG